MCGKENEQVTVLFYCCDYWRAPKCSESQPFTRPKSVTLTVGPIYCIQENGTRLPDVQRAIPLPGFGVGNTKLSLLTRLVMRVPSYADR